MGYFRSLPKISAISFIVSQAFFTLPVYAAGFQINEISPGLQGAAMAGDASTNNDVSSIFINPANLSTLIHNQVYLGASEILPRINMSNASATHTVNIPGILSSSTTATVQGKNFENHLATSAFVPDGYLGWRINDRLVAGLAVTAPYGLKTDYAPNSIVRFVARYSSVRSINVTPMISFALTNMWSVGFGFQAQYVKAIFSNYDGPYTGMPAIDELIAASNPTYLTADGWGYGYTVGMLFKPDACTRLGIGFRSLISHQASGDGQQYTTPGGTVPAPSNDFLFNAQTTVHAKVKTPAILTLSAARDIANWTLKATAQINFWNTFRQLSIDMPQAFANNSTIITKWRNSWFGAIGADYRATPAWTLRGGLAYDQTPTTGFRDPRIPDNSRIWTSVGATYNWNKCLSFDGAYTHLFINSQTVNVTQALGTSANSTVPLEVNQVYAKFKGSADIVALAIRYNF